MNEQEKNNHLMRLASFFSVGTAFVLMIAKLATFILTGSMAILSSLFDSVQDMLTSLVNLIAVREATTPADKEHRFGHGKAQALGGLIQSLIIMLASCILLKESIIRLMNPQELREIGLGLSVTILAIILTAGLISFQRLVVKRTQSLSIKADLAHYTGDIFMNIGVCTSIIISYYLKWYFIDALFGIFVALYLICSISIVLKESLNMLMDKEISPQIRKEIKKTACSIIGVYDCFDLKTRLSGNEMFAQCSVSLDDELSLKDAHEKTDIIEEKIHQKYPTMHLVIHPEPISQNKRGRTKHQYILDQSKNPKLPTT